MPSHRAIVSSPQVQTVLFRSKRQLSKIYRTYTPPGTWMAHSAWEEMLTDVRAEAESEPVPTALSTLAYNFCRCYRLDDPKGGLPWCVPSFSCKPVWYRRPGRSFLFS